MRQPRSGPDSTAPKAPIYGLDLARFIAALAVVFYHLGFKPFGVETNALHQQIGGPISLPSWWASTFWGWIGVQVFFVISGVVISHSARQRNGWSFFAGRISRLLPGMLVCATICAAISPFLFDIPLDATVLLWLKSIIFFPLAPWIAGQIWTLPVEIAFYSIVWLFVINKWQNHFITLACALSAMIAAYWMVTSVIGLADPYGPLTLILLLQHGCYFALGMVLCELDNKRLGKREIAVVAVCAATAYLQIRSTAAAEARDSLLVSYHLLIYAIWFLTTTLMGCAIAARDTVATALKRFAGPLRLIGLMTYPLYLVHVHVGGATLLAALEAGLAPRVAIGLGALTSLLAAYFITRWLEPVARAAVDVGLRQAKMAFDQKANGRMGRGGVEFKQ